MTWAEMRSDMVKVRITLESILAKKYPGFLRDGAQNFTIPSGDSFRLCVMGDALPWNFIVIEYGSGEDGDGYYPEDYESADEMVSDMIREIDAA